VKGINIHPRNMTMFKGVQVVRDGRKSVAAAGVTAKAGAGAAR
jgi:hypothetical protein